MKKLSKEEKKKYIYGKYEWDIIPHKKSDKQKVASWDRVFNVKNRCTTYISDYYYEIKETLKEYLLEKGVSFSDGSRKKDLVDVVKQFENHRIKDVKREKGSHLKKAFLSYVCSVGNEDLLFTLFDIKVAA